MRAFTHYKGQDSLGTWIITLLCRVYICKTTKSGFLQLREDVRYPFLQFFLYACMWYLCMYSYRISFCIGFAPHTMVQWFYVILLIRTSE